MGVSHGFPMGWFGFPSRFAGVSLGFPSQGLSFPHVLQGFPSGFLLKVWVSLTFCRGFPRVSVSGFKFPSCFARVSLGFPSKGLGFPHVLQGFPSGFPLRVSVSLMFYKGFCLPPKVEFSVLNSFFLDLAGAL